METLKTLTPPNPYMNTISTHFRTQLRVLSYTTFQPFCTSSINLYNAQESITQSKSCRTRATVSNSEVNKKWLASLSCPVPENAKELSSEETNNGVGLDWVIGIDPDVSGALALLKRDGSGLGYIARVFDNPYVQVSVGKRVRKRLDAKSIVQLLQSFDAPCGTTAYIEQSIPFPKDGKQDDSRKAATALFPTLSSSLTRKKDHGRAEALLIAAYGKGLKIKSETPSEIEELCTTLT